MGRFPWLVIIGAVSGSATITAGFMLEKLFLEEWEWWRWGILCSLFVVMTLWAGWKLHRLDKPKEKRPKGDLVDYMTACWIANRYIDPDETMGGGKLITVRAQILARFDKVVGARVGDQYNGQLLHQWLQKNAACCLVAHQDEIT